MNTCLNMCRRTSTKTWFFPNSCFMNELDMNYFGSFTKIMDFEIFCCVDWNTGFHTSPQIILGGTQHTTVQPDQFQCQRMDCSCLRQIRCLSAHGLFMQSSRQRIGVPAAFYFEQMCLPLMLITLSLNSSLSRNKVEGTFFTLFYSLEIRTLF